MPVAIVDDLLRREKQVLGAPRQATMAQQQERIDGEVDTASVQPNVKTHVFAKTVAVPDRANVSWMSLSVSVRVRRAYPTQMNSTCCIYVGDVPVVSTCDRPGSLAQICCKVRQCNVELRHHASLPSWRVGFGYRFNRQQTS